jgi:ribose transport system permease protein
MSASTSVPATSDATRSHLLKRVLREPQLPFIAVLTVIMWVGFAATTDNYGSFNGVFALGTTLTTVGLASLGLTVTIIAGEIDLSIGTNAALASVIAVQFSDSLGALGAVLLAITVSSLIGAFNGFGIAKLRVSSLMFTVGMLTVLWGAARIVSGERTVTLTNFEFGDFLKERWWIFSPTLVIVLLAVLAVAMFLRYHKYGREIYAVGGARKEAIAAGISLTRPMVIAFLIAGACAGLAGALVGQRGGSASPDGLQAILLTGTTAAFVGGASIRGGRGSGFGALFGAIAVAVLSVGLSFRGTPQYLQSAWIGALLVTVVLIEIVAQRIDTANTRREVLQKVSGTRARQGPAPPKET